MKRAAAAFLAPFAFYLAACYPGLSPYRDSGDLAASALTLGVAHPPGYAFYTVAGKAFLTLVPWANPAFRLNVLSALAAAAAIALVGYYLRRETEFEPARWAGPLFLLLAPAFGALAQVSEMYAFNALFCAGLLVVSLDRTHPTYLYLAGFLAGLGVANHQTLILVVPAMLWAMIGRPYLGPVRANSLLHAPPPASPFSVREHRHHLYWAGAFFVLGASIHLFLPVRAAADPAVLWGEPDTVKGLWRVLTRSDYGGLRLHPERPINIFTPQAIFDAVRLSRITFVRQFGPVGLSLAVLCFFLERRRLWAKTAMLAFFLSGPVFFWISNLDPRRLDSLPILEPHAVLPLIPLAVLAAAGLAVVVERFPAGRRAHAAWGLLALHTVWMLWAGRPPVNRANHAAEDYARGLLASMDRGALVVDPDDPTAFSLTYLRHARDARPDARWLFQFRTRWGYEQIKTRDAQLLPQQEIRSGKELQATLYAYNLPRRPVYADLPQKVPEHYSWHVQGLAYRILSARPKTQKAWGAALAASRARRELLRFRRVGEDVDFFTRHAQDYMASAANNLAIEALALGRVKEAQSDLRLALFYNPGLSQAWNNLGNAALRLGDAEEAERKYRLTLKYAPENAYFVYNLGRALALQKRTTKAASTFEKALRLGDIPDPANDLALIRWQEGEVLDALRMWKKVVWRHPGYAPAYFNLGMAYEKVKEYRLAANAYRSYLSLNTNPAEAPELEKKIAINDARADRAEAAAGRED